MFLCSTQKVAAHCLRKRPCRNWQLFSRIERWTLRRVSFPPKKIFWLVSTSSVDLPHGNIQHFKDVTSKFQAEAFAKISVMMMLLWGKPIVADFPLLSENQDLKNITECLRHFHQWVQRTRCTVYKRVTSRSEEQSMHTTQHSTAASSTYWKARTFQVEYGTKFKKKLQNRTLLQNITLNIIKKSSICKDCGNSRLFPLTRRPASALSFPTKSPKLTASLPVRQRHRMSGIEVGVLLSKLKR